MPLFSKVKIYCCVCGNQFEVTCNDGTKFQKAWCSRECLDAKEKLYVQSLLGKDAE